MIYGRSQISETWAIADRIDKETTNILVDDSPDIPIGTDASPFFDKDIKVLYFEAANTFDHTHTVFDRFETLNKDLLEKITSLVTAAVKEIANE
jgi:hypothetical protein